MSHEFPWEPADAKDLMDVHEGSCFMQKLRIHLSTNPPPPPPKKKSAQKYSKSTSGDLKFYTSFNLVGNVSLSQKDGCHAACNEGELTRSTHIYIFASFCMIRNYFCTIILRIITFKISS
jgi:hypothetical protein